jgi:uncharacterized protein (TIRG00374 family)
LFVYGFVSIFLLVNIFAKQTTNFSQLFIVLAIIFTLGVIAFFISFNERVINIVINLLKSRQDKKFRFIISLKIQKLILSYKSYKTKKLVLLVFFVLTLFEIFAGILINFLVATGLSINVPITYFLAYLPIMMLLVRIPISFSGLGITEGGAIYFLGPIGVPAAYAFSIGVINHFISLAGLLPGALFYALNRKIKIKKNELETNSVLVEK